MDTCVLYPPTNQVYSGAVIAGVVQRSRTRGDYSDDPRWPRYLLAQEATGQYVPDHSTSRSHKTSTNGPITTMDRKYQDMTTPTTRMFRLPIESRSGAASANTDFALDRLAELATLTSCMEQEKRQREVRRTRQIRYRKKQHEYTMMLEDKNRELRQDIENLKQRHNAICAAVPTTTTVWNVVVEYFRLFRYGLRASDIDNRSTPVSDTNISVQLDFLRSSMAPDVTYNAGRGVESIMKNWNYFSMWFQDVKVELVGLKTSGADSLMASTKTSFTITERTLVNVFPHLHGNDADAAGRQLAAKLREQKIVMRGFTLFDWDSGYGRVTSVISESDMLTPMLRILGSLEHVARVFEKSVISLTPYRSQSRQTWRM